MLMRADLTSSAEFVQEQPGTVSFTCLLSVYVWGSVTHPARRTSAAPSIKMVFFRIIIGFPFLITGPDSAFSWIRSCSQNHGMEARESPQTFSPHVQGAAGLFRVGASSVRVHKLVRLNWITALVKDALNLLQGCHGTVVGDPGIVSFNIGLCGKNTFNTQEGRPDLCGGVVSNAARYGQFHFLFVGVSVL